MTSLQRGIFAVTSALVLVTAAPAAGQGFTVSTPDSSARITFGGRVQTIFNTTSVDDEPATQTELRRVRLEATLQMGRVVGGKIQPEFAGSRVLLKDAYVRLNFDPALQVWAGQAHRPFGVISPASTTRLTPMEKGLRIRGVSDAFDEYNILLGLGYSDRDVGLQLRGEPAGAPVGLSYAVGFFNGPARTLAPDENTYQVVARVAAHPVEWARVGVGYSRIDFANVIDDVSEVETHEGTAWEADVELGSERAGPRLVAEVTRGDFDPFAGAEFWGAQGWVSYRTGRASSTIAGLEPFVRVSHGDPDMDDVIPDLDADAVGGTLVTPGINLWLGGLNRFGLNYEIWNPETGKGARSFKALFQMAF
ncbi:MAG TPA: porin [Longimicrobium sp.]|nr:porin [Longimicrobium sp.]